MAERLEGLDEVTRAVCVREHHATEKTASNEKEIVTFTNLTEYNAEVFGSIRCIEGNKEDFENLKEGECIVPACISTEYDLKPGDEITISFFDADKNYIIKGIYSDIYSTSNAFNNYILVKQLPAQLPDCKLYDSQYHDFRCEDNCDIQNNWL